MISLGQALQERGFWRSALAIVQLGRPKFLLGGVALYGLGTLTAYVQGFGFAFSAYLWGQLTVTAIQLMTHYSNDYFDYQADIANPSPTAWSGGSRVLVRGLLPRKIALWVALVLAGLACLALALLVSHAQRPWQLSALVLLTMLVLAWSYSSPPLRLHSRGLGEPTVAIVVPLLTPFSGYIVQTGEFGWLPILLSAPLSMLLIAMLLTLEFPDEAGDRIADKVSWVVLFGARRVATLCSLLIVFGFVTSFSSVSWGVPAAVATGWLWLTPVGLFQLVRMLKRDWRRPEAWPSLALGSVLLFFLALLVDLIVLCGVANQLNASR
jgi:1,4-dihydroxy-2-naphthoate octaprenyltransferase